MASQRIWLHYTIRAVKRKQLCLLGQGLACKLFEKLGMPPICIQHKKQPRKFPRLFGEYMIYLVRNNTPTVPGPQ